MFLLPSISNWDTCILLYLMTNGDILGACVSPRRRSWYKIVLQRRLNTVVIMKISARCLPFSHHLKGVFSCHPERCLRAIFRNIILRAQRGWVRGWEFGSSAVYCRGIWSDRFILRIFPWLMVQQLRSMPKSCTWYSVVRICILMSQGHTLRGIRGLLLINMTWLRSRGTSRSPCRRGYLPVFNVLGRHILQWLKFDVRAWLVHWSVSAGAQVTGRLMINAIFIR